MGIDSCTVAVNNLYIYKWILKLFATFPVGEIWNKTELLLDERMRLSFPSDEIKTFDVHMYTYVQYCVQFSLFLYLYLFYSNVSTFEVSTAVDHVYFDFLIFSTFIELLGETSIRWGFSLFRIQLCTLQTEVVILTLRSLHFSLNTNFWKFGKLSILLFTIFNKLPFCLFRCRWEDLFIGCMSCV